MSTINPNFQPTQLANNLPQANATDSISYKGSGRFGKQGALSKIWTSMKSASAGGRHFIKKDNQQALSKLSQALRMQGLDSTKASQIVGRIGADADIESGRRVLNGADIQRVMADLAAIDNNINNVVTTLQNSNLSAHQGNCTVSQGLVMGIVNSSTDLKEVSQNQLHQIADRMLTQLLGGEAANATPAARLQNINSLLAELNSPLMKELIADMRDGIIVKNDAQRTAAPSPQSINLINLIKFKLECQQASISGGASPQFSPTLSTQTSPQARATHLRQVAAPGSSVVALANSFGLSVQTLGTLCRDYCQRISDAALSEPVTKVFLRDNHTPIKAFTDILSAPLRDLQEPISALADSFGPKTESGEEIAMNSPKVYTSTYETKMDMAVSSFMHILNSNPVQRDAYVSTVRELYLALANGIDQTGLEPSQQLKREALNAVIQKSLPAALAMGIQSGEFSTLISRAILYTNPQMGIGIDLLDDFRAMFTGPGHYLSA